MCYFWCHRYYKQNKNDLEQSDHLQANDFKWWQEIHDTLSNQYITIYKLFLVFCCCTVVPCTIDLNQVEKRIMLRSDWSDEGSAARRARAQHTHPVKKGNKTAFWLWACCFTSDWYNPEPLLNEQFVRSFITYIVMFLLSLRCVHPYYRNHSIQTKALQSTQQQEISSQRPLLVVGGFFFQPFT